MTRKIAVLSFFFFLLNISLACFDNFTTGTLENQISSRIKDMISAKEEIPKR